VTDSACLSLYTRPWSAACNINNCPRPAIHVLSDILFC
jgi:hypothetical protein